MAIIDRNIAVPAAAVLLAVSSFAQVNGVIEGTVKDAQGRPIQKAEIRALRTDTPDVYRATTDSNGQFRIALPAGVYTVELQSAGDILDTVQRVSVRSGQAVQLPFVIQPAGDEQARARQKALDKNKALNDAFNSGIDALHASRYEEAIRYLTQAGGIDPKQRVIWAHLEDAYDKLAGTRSGAEQRGLLAMAAAAGEKAIALDPADAAILSNHATVLGKLGRIVEARAAIAQAVALDPANADRYYHNLGAMLYNNGDPRGALDAWGKVARNSELRAKADAGIDLIASDRIIEAVQTPAFTAALTRFVTAARTHFEGLKGKRDEREFGIQTWDATDRLPGAKSCRIYDTGAGSVQLICEMIETENVAAARSLYDQLAAVMGRALPKDGEQRRADSIVAQFKNGQVVAVMRRVEKRVLVALLINADRQR